MKRLLYLLLLLVIQPLAVHGATAYQYAYVTENGQIEGAFRPRYILNFVDASDLTIKPRTLPLPDWMYVCGNPSPDGGWLLLCYADTNYYRATLTQGYKLLEMSTGIIHHIADVAVADDDFSGYAGPRWSPDGRYLIWNTFGRMQNNIQPYFTQLYDLQTQTVSTIFSTIQEDPDSQGGVDIQNFSAREWSPDGTRIAVIERECYVTDRYNCYQSMLAVYSFPELARLASVEIDGFGSTICPPGIIWSLDNRYLSFVLACEDMGMGLPFNEVFLWDTQITEMQQLTANTNPPPSEWTEYPQEKRAQYDLLWTNAQTLVVGGAGGALVPGNDGLAYDPATVFTRTERYHLPDTAETVLSDTFNHNFASSPTADHIAFRSEGWIVNAEGHSEAVDEQVQIATFDGTDFLMIASAPEGCEDLNWSPSGAYLAYSLPIAQEGYGDCFNPVGVMFVRTDGLQSRYDFPDPSLVRGQIGWVQSPGSDVTAPLFPDGTPTPYPTMGPVG
jgi:hypothetical protein